MVGPRFPTQGRTGALPALLPLSRALGSPDRARGGIGNGSLFFRPTVTVLHTRACVQSSWQHWSRSGNERVGEEGCGVLAVKMSRGLGGGVGGHYLRRRGPRISPQLVFCRESREPPANAGAGKGPREITARRVPTQYHVYSCYCRGNLSGKRWRQWVAAEELVCSRRWLRLRWRLGAASLSSCGYRRQAFDVQSDRCCEGPAYSRSHGGPQQGARA